MKRTSTKLMAALALLVGLCIPMGMWGQTWERVNSITTLLEGGTFIMGYEATAQSGEIVPLRSADCDATLTANGYFYSGTTANSSTNETISMTNLSGTTTSDYEVYITASSTSGYINIQRTDNTGNFYGASSGGTSKNTGRLYSAGNSNETNIKPEWASESNNQFKLSVNVTGQYKYLKYNTGSPRFAFYNSAGEKIVFYKKTNSGTTVATPTFSPNGGNFVDSQDVEISCSTQGAAIHYSYEENPATWLDYPAAGLNLTETTTVYAYATKEGMTDSPVNSATFTKVTPYTTIPDIFDKATEVGSTQTDIYVTFSNWTVVGKSYVNAYVTDGQYGLNVYGSGNGFEIGDKLSGTVACKVQLFNGGAELVNLTTNTSGLTVSHNNTFDPYVISLADLTGHGIYFGSYVDLGNLTYSDGKFIDGNEHEINPYNTFNISDYPTLTAGTTYRVKGVYIRYYNNNTLTERIAPVYASDFTEFVGPTLAISPATANPFTYVYDAGPSLVQEFTVTGSDLTSDDITATITAGASYFEVSNGGDYTNSVTIESGDAILIRMKADLAKGNYQGTLTLSTDGATSVTVALSGTVTGQTYTIEQYSLPTTAHGTITFDPASPVEDGTEVTLTATPAEGYDFTADSWVFYKDGGEDFVIDNSIEVTNNKFDMPAYALWVDGTFIPKPTNIITCAVAPEGKAQMQASPASAYEGQTITLSITNVAEGYTLSSIVITKTSDGSATSITPTASGADYTFTMPGYAVTATATFMSDTFEGDFVLFTGDFEEGDYILVYENNAMTNTIASNKFTSTLVTPTENTITNPSTSIVWHISRIGTTNYWEIYNAKEGKYVNGASGSTNVSLETTTNNNSNAQWYVTKENNTYDFGSKVSESLSSKRFLRKNGNVFGHYTSGYGGKLTLYKYTILTERTITFNGNGGTYNNENTYTQTVYDGIAANLVANKFTKANSVFVGWSTQNGEEEYADGASITVNSDITLYAQWATSYTAMVDDEIEGGSVYIVTPTGDEEIIEAAEGAEITLTYSTNVGYAFSAWVVYYTDEEDQNVPVEVTDNKFIMPAYDVIVSATFVEVTTYSLVTNVNQIVSGKHYIIASGTNGSVKVMAGQNSNNRASVVVTATEGVIPETEGIYEFVINGPFTFNEKDCYTIYDKNASSTGYLYAASSGSNYLRTKAELDANGKWNIEIDGNSHKATVKAQGNYTRNWMRNNGSLFSCYASGQSDIYLYVKDNDHNLEYYGTEITYSGTSIPDDETITIGAGSVMTISNPEFTNIDPNNLIIEDGGQLVTPTAVVATMQKNITGYNASSAKAAAGGWYFISSPLDGATTELTAIENLIPSVGDYDLYAFDEGQASNEKEWRNFKVSDNNLNGFNAGQGYLYANSEGLTIAFSGAVRANTTSFIKEDLSYTPANRFAGWNLVGNPFPSNAKVSLPYYKMNSTSEGLNAIPNAADGVIATMEGVFVCATATEKSVTFTATTDPVTAAASAKGAINLNVESEGELLDRAIVAINGAGMLGKLNLNGNVTKLYIPQGGKDYAIVVSAGQGEMPVNFKASKAGNYTISVEPKDVDVTYLHLIDNMTGADIDLLATPSYSFEAKTSDYASRFRLVFSANEGSNENATETFAYYNGSEWVISNMGDATLQVVDVMGRVLSSETISGNANVNINQAAGIYMLRLVNGENVKVQKVVVR